MPPYSTGRERPGRALARCLLSLGLLASTLVSTAAAQERADPEAQAHFMAGTEAFDAGDYERAVTEFRAAYALTPHPDVLFNIYSAAERASQLQVAEEALVRYLAEGAIEDERRPVLQERLVRLRQRIADREAEHEPGAEAEAGAERDTEPEAVSEAEHELGADPVREAEPPATGGVHPAGVGVLVGAGALLVSFAVFAGLSSAEDSALAERCAREACEAADVETLNTFNVVADVSWIGAATLGVVGLILLLALPPESASESRVALAPWASPDGAGLAVRGSL